MWQALTEAIDKFGRELRGDGESEQSPMQNDSELDSLVKESVIIPTATLDDEVLRMGRPQRARLGQSRVDQPPASPQGWAVNDVQESTTVDTSQQPSQRDPTALGGEEAWHRSPDVIIDSNHLPASTSQQHKSNDEICDIFTTVGSSLGQSSIGAGITTSNSSANRLGAKDSERMQESYSVYAERTWRDKGLPALRFRSLHVSSGTAEGAAARGAFNPESTDALLQQRSETLQSSTSTVEGHNKPGCLSMAPKAHECIEDGRRATTQQGQSVSDGMTPLTVY